MNLVNRWVEIKCFKHNGTFHRFWDRAYILYNDHNYIITASKKSKVKETNGRSWFSKEPAISVFSKQDWFNVICMIKKDGISYYCNIASPALIDNYTIKYIDYDLDIKYNEKKQLKILDKKEYGFHKKKFNYSDDLNLILSNQILEVTDMIKKHKFPFNDKQILNYYNKFLERFETFKDD